MNDITNLTSHSISYSVRTSVLLNIYCVNVSNRINIKKFRGDYNDR